MFGSFARSRQENDYYIWKVSKLHNDGVCNTRLAAISSTFKQSDDLTLNSLCTVSDSIKRKAWHKNYHVRPDIRRLQMRLHYQGRVSTMQ
ncbi:hypothetical protein FPOAC1_007703 [Fusarium poae]|uniref:hypothetical protein n=1 Tax=Fusarium poae TaxID=36050 RepID=UPI001CE7F854|nr:hypothetical protein FPOAC1_007703 [Fusarium poae]KAG8668324.1 hypothetical protein FPOAC1_007703 [Fusarium poae]